MSHETEDGQLNHTDEEQDSSQMLPKDKHELEELRRSGSLKDWRIFILSNELKKYHKERAEQEIRDRGETSKSNQQTDLPCKPSIKPRVWSIHEQIAKMSFVLDTNENKESQIGAIDFQSNLSKDTFDDIAELGYEFQNADSRLQDEIYCAVALTSLRKDMETLKQILSCDSPTNGNCKQGGAQSISNGSWKKENSEVGVKNSADVSCVAGSSQNELHENMQETGQFDRFDFENGHDITPRIVRETLGRAGDNIAGQNERSQVGYSLDGRNQKHDCIAGIEAFDREVITIEEADRGSEEVSYRQIDLGRKNEYISNNEKMVTDNEDLKSIISNSKNRSWEPLIGTNKVQGSIVINSEEMICEVAEYVSKQSIELAIHKESLSIMIDENMEMNDYCSKLNNELELKQNENDRLREELRNLQKDKLDATVSKVTHEASEANPPTVFETRVVPIVITEAENSNDVMMIEESRLSYYVESLHPIIAKLLVKQSLEYAIKTVELDEKLSREVYNWNEVINMWKSKVEDERKDKVKAFDMLESSEKRIEMIMNDLNGAKGLLEQSKEALTQEKGKVKGLTSQNEKLELKITKMREGVQKKAEEKEELENLCLELTKTCDILLEKCHVKDENLKLLKGELKSASDEVVVSKDKIIKHEFDVDLLINAMAKLIAIYSVRYALQSIEASQDKDRIVQLESDFQNLAQKQADYLQGLEKNQDSAVNLRMEYALAEKYAGQLSVNNACEAPMIATVAGDTVEVGSIRSSDVLIERSEEREGESGGNGNCIPLGDKSGSDDHLPIIENELTSKNSAEDGLNYTDFAKLIVNRSVNEAVRVFRSGNYIAFINHRLKLERMKSWKKQKQIADFLASNQSLQQENKQLKKDFERVLTISNSILKEYCNSFMKMISNFNCLIELKDLNDMKKQLATFTEKCMSENFSRFTHIPPDIGSTLFSAETYNAGSNEDGRNLLRRQRSIRGKSYVTENIDEARYMGGGSEKQSHKISEVESCLQTMQRLVAKYICDIAVSRALMWMGIGSDEILEYYLNKKDNVNNQKFNISFEKEANIKDSMLVVTAVNEGLCMSEKQQQMLTILEHCDPLLLHEMESLEDLFSRFRAAKLMHNYPQQPGYRGYNSSNSSELEFERFSQESLRSAFEEGIGEVKSPYTAEDCFGFATLVDQDSNESFISVAREAVNQIEQNASSIEYVT